MKSKKNLGLVLIIFSNYVFGAAPILTSEINPAAWDNNDVYKVDTNAVDLSIVGENQTWTIPSTSIVSGSVYTSYVGEVASTTPYASTFSVSSVSIQDTDEELYTYFTTSESQLELDGYADVAGYTLFTDPAVLFTFPFTYNGTITDNVAGNVEAGYSLTFSGTTNTIADAHGTLNLPSGSYNVLRVKITQNITANTLGASINTTNTTYYWYSDAHKSPLLEVITIQTVGSGFLSSINEYSKRVTIGTLSPLAVRNNASTENMFFFYPNPLKDRSNLSFTIGKPSNVVISIVSALGQEQVVFAKTKLSEGIHNEEIDLSNYAKGVYTVKMSIDEVTSHKQIIIQ